MGKTPSCHVATTVKGPKQDITVMPYCSHHVRESCLWNLEYLKILLVESGILGFWNTRYRSRNPEYHERLESRILVPLTKTGIQFLESAALNSLTWGWGYIFWKQYGECEDSFCFSLFLLFSSLASTGAFYGGGGVGK